MLFDSLFMNGEFQLGQTLKNEIEKWLQYIDSKGQLDRYKPRFSSSRTQRVEALAEISSAYFVDQILGYGILDWEVKTNGTKNVDFILKVGSGKVYAEVKSPGWEGELDVAERAERKKFPKYYKTEARHVAPWISIRHAIYKSHEKFLPDCRNIVIMMDDLFLSPWEIPGQENIALFEEIGIYGKEKGYFADTRFKNVSGILILGVLPSGEKVEYIRQYIANKNAKMPLALSL